MEDNYQGQAIRFLIDTDTKFESELIECAPYFPEDKEPRNIYRITLKRKGKRYSFKFGQSIVNTQSGTAPTPYDVLACMTSSDPGTFENFCDELGMDQDSRTAERIYKAVVKEWAGVNRLFSDVMEQLQEIQ